MLGKQFTPSPISPLLHYHCFLPPSSTRLNLSMSGARMYSLKLSTCSISTAYKPLWRRHSRRKICETSMQ